MAYPGHIYMLFVFLSGVGPWGLRSFLSGLYGYERLIKKYFSYMKICNYISYDKSLIKEVLFSIHYPVDHIR